MLRDGGLPQMSTKYQHYVMTLHQRSFKIENVEVGVLISNFNAKSVVSFITDKA